jgi:hypothetical protein
MTQEWIKDALPQAYQDPDEGNMVMDVECLKDAFVEIRNKIDKQQLPTMSAFDLIEIQAQIELLNNIITAL